MTQSMLHVSDWRDILWHQNKQLFSDTREQAAVLKHQNKQLFFDDEPKDDAAKIIE